MTRQESPATESGVPWARVVTEALVGHTCLWQDLDGLHIEPAPDQPPQTSILWAWSEAGAMVRMRLDGGVGYVATCASGVPTTDVLPWAPADGRVQAVRHSATSLSGLALRLEQHVDDGLDAGSGPITFFRESRQAGA